MILAGSPLCDTDFLRQKLAKSEGILRIEHVILDARTGDHNAVLVGLVRDVRDFVSAEIYCAVGGGVEGVLERKVALGLGGMEGGEVGKFVNGLFGGSTPSPAADEEVKKRLMMMLLEVHMRDP